MFSSALKFLYWPAIARPVRGLCVSFAAAILITVTVAGFASADVPTPAGREMVELRTAQSRTYADGVDARGHDRFITKLYSEPVHFSDGRGGWQAIDTRLVRASGGGWRSSATAFSARIGERLEDGVRFGVGADSVDFRLVGARGAQRVEGSRAESYSGIDGVRVDYEVVPDRLKESLILSPATAPSSFRFAMTLSRGLRPRLTAQGAVAFQRSGRTVFEAAAPFALIQGRADAPRPDVVSYRLQETARGWDLLVVVDPDWLAAQDPSSKVVIDPTMNLTNAQPDCFINSTSANTSSCATATMQVGRSGTTSKRRGLIRFPVDQLPTPIDVTDAELHLWSTSASNSGTVTLNVHRLTRAFASTATWNKASSTTNWTTAGGDFDSTAWASTTMSGAAGNRDVVWGGLGERVEDWREGRTANDGMLIKQSAESITDVKQFATSEATNPAQRPTLWVRYANTSLSGTGSTEGPMSITPAVDPVSNGIDASGGGVRVMWISPMPVTKTVNKVTLGDIASAGSCTNNAVVRLIVRRYDTQGYYGSSPQPLAMSISDYPLSFSLGRQTFETTPFTMVEGMGYSFELKAISGCSTILQRTWQHGGDLFGNQVNPGPDTCQMGGPPGLDASPPSQGQLGRAIWHTQGISDNVGPCVYGNGLNPWYMDPSIPSGWYLVDSSNGFDYYMRSLPSGTACTSDSRYQNLPLTDVPWGAAGDPPGYKVCRWDHLAPYGTTVPAGWYYAAPWPRTAANPMNPRDMYFKIEADDAALAARYKPALLFDSSEHWRPLDIDQFLGEGVHTVCPTGTPPCYPVNDGATLLSSYNNPSARLDVEGDNPDRNEESQYQSPLPECVDSTKYDCDGDESPAAAQRTRMYWGVTPPATPTGYRFIQYWLYYRYNSYSDSGPFNDSQHEGDWEAFAIAPSHTDQDTFDFASFSEHGHWFSYLRTNLQCVDVPGGDCGTEGTRHGRRAKVFVANGSHANYAFPCHELVPYLTCVQDNQLGGLVPIPERGHDGSQQWSDNGDGPAGLVPLGAWNAWGGVWSINKDDVKSPGNQDMWPQPWGECGIGQGGCALPASRGRVATPSAAARACGAWFGPGVATVLCGERELARAFGAGRLGEGRGLRLSVGRKRARRSSVTSHSPAARTVAITQLMGTPLRPGDTVVVSGRRRAPVTLAVRMQTGRQRTRAGYAAIPAGSGSRKFIVVPQRGTRALALQPAR